MLHSDSEGDAREGSGHQSDRSIWRDVKPDQQTLAEARDALEGSHGYDCKAPLYTTPVIKGTEGGPPSAIFTIHAMADREKKWTKVSRWQARKRGRRHLQDTARIATQGSAVFHAQVVPEGSGTCRPWVAHRESPWRPVHPARSPAAARRSSTIRVKARCGTLLCAAWPVTMPPHTASRCVAPATTVCSESTPCIPMTSSVHG